ncbi:MAG: hypothetical protein NC089_00175 [Bacteroides sp.]|nr:hypothetical protein [Bacteroides sp.]MCM1549372.1 hypothetical protein [Clostridium sp.]
MKKYRKKALAVMGCLFCVLILNGCQLNMDGMRRRNAYTKEELEAYLEDTYGEDFTILSRKEVYSLNTLQKIVYEVQWDSDEDIVFQVNDLNDGAAGWSVNDNWEQTMEDYETNIQEKEED